MIDLIQHSLNVIRHNQQASGAYPACPTMPDYQFCWFRDSSFIAHAMLLYGENASAYRFHEWAASTIDHYRPAAMHAMTDFAVGKTPNSHDVLRARYTYDGGKGPDDWPEFQLDGLGTWLWALHEFAERGYPLGPGILGSAAFVADYLSVLWCSPCHDLWEEHGDQVHTYTLAAIYAGLICAAELLRQPHYAATAAQIHRYLLENCRIPAHGFVKAVGVDLVDGSLTALAVPYRVSPLRDPAIESTVARIETDLYVPGTGVHRYLGDSYYGGGAWLLLAAWLGWYYAERGEFGRAREILDGIAAQNRVGDLPEQMVPPTLTSSADHDHWVQVRGAIATPLLWSHAMYLILADACRQQ